MHELGHLLGCDHDDHGLMQESLPLGTRRLAEFDMELAEATDAIFADECF